VLDIWAIVNIVQPDLDRRQDLVDAADQYSAGIGFIILFRRPRSRGCVA
jgi:hypothetical protein